MAETEATERSRTSRAVGAPRTSKAPRPRKAADAEPTPSADADTRYDELLRRIGDRDLAFELDSVVGERLADLSDAAPPVVRARCFEVVDAKGRPRVVMADAIANGGPGIVLLDSNGERHFTAHFINDLADHEGVSLTITNADGTEGVHLFANNHGGAIEAIHDDDALPFGATGDLEDRLATVEKTLERLRARYERGATDAEVDEYAERVSRVEDQLAFVGGQLFMGHPHNRGRRLMFRDEVPAPS